MLVLPSTAGPKRSGLHVTIRFSGASRMPSSLSERYLSRRSPLNSAAFLACSASKTSFTRRRVKEVFEAEHAKNAAEFSGERRDKYLSLKLEGILEAPLNLIVTCKPDRFGPAVLGKTSIRDVEIYSACLAVENMWLTARAEGVGMGWVSILRNDALAEIFGIPADVIPIAYLCVGYVREFPDRPILASKDWAQRLPPRSLIHFDSWNDAEDRTKPAAESLLKKIDDHSIWLSIFPEDSPDKPPSRE